MAVGADGSIAVGGSSGGDLAVARLRADGTPETAFSGDGIQTTDLGGTDNVVGVGVRRQRGACRRLRRRDAGAGARPLSGGGGARPGVLRRRPRLGRPARVPRGRGDGPARRRRDRDRRQLRPGERPDRRRPWRGSASTASRIRLRRRRRPGARPRRRRHLRRADRSRRDLRRRAGAEPRPRRRRDGRRLASTPPGASIRRSPTAASCAPTRGGTPTAPRRGRPGRRQDRQRGSQGELHGHSNPATSPWPGTCSPDPTTPTPTESETGATVARSCSGRGGRRVARWSSARCG